MPTFNSVEALKKEILKRMKTALEYAEFDTQKILMDYTKRFYEEYDPVQYIRTGQLWNSIYDTIGESNVTPVGNIGYQTTVGFNGKWNYTDGPDDRGWTTKEIVQANMYGHPQHNIAVWKDSMSRLRDNGEAYKILKESLNEAGLPVK